MKDRTINYAGTQQFYDKEQIDEKLQAIMGDLSAVYTKTEIDDKFANYYNKTSINELLLAYVTETVLDGKLALYFDKNYILANYYNKSDVDSKFLSEEELDEKLTDYTLKADFNSAIDELSTKVGDITSLATADKTSTVQAINELCNKIGNLNNLLTFDKTSLVNAINNVYEKADDIRDDLEALNNDYQNEKTRAIQADELHEEQINANAQAISDEQVRAEAVEGSLTDDIADHENRIIELENKEVQVMNLEGEHTTTGMFDENLLYPAVKYTADMSEQAYDGNFYELPSWLELETKPAGAKFAYVDNGVVRFTASVPMLSGTIYGEPEAVAQNKAAFDTITWIGNTVPLTDIIYKTPTINVNNTEGETTRSVATQNVQAFVDYKQNAINERLDARSSENRAMIRELQKKGFTFVIDSNEALDDFLSKKEGNDYTYTLVKQGTWQADYEKYANGVTLPAVELLEGENGATILDLPPVSKIKSIKNLVLNDTTFHAGINIALESAEVYAARLSEIESIINCTVYFQLFKSPASGALYTCCLVSCSNVEHNSFTVRSTDVSAAFVNCTNMNNNSIDTAPITFIGGIIALLKCKRVNNNDIYAHGVSQSGQVSPVYGCKECVGVTSNVTSVTDNGVAYQESYASSTAVEAYACADTPAGGWNA